MTVLEFFKAVIGQIWDGMSQINVPLLDIPITSFLIGAFVVQVAIMILNPLLGIGAGFIDNLTSSVRRSRASRSAAARSHASAARAEARASDRALRDVNRWV